MTKDAKLEPGKDTIRDPFTGEVFEIASVLLPEHIHRFTDGASYRGSSAERSALYGTEGNSRAKTAHQRHQHTRLIVRNPKPAKGAA